MYRRLGAAIGWRNNGSHWNRIEKQTTKHTAPTGFSFFFDDWHNVSAGLVQWLLSFPTVNKNWRQSENALSKKDEKRTDGQLPSFFPNQLKSQTKKKRFWKRKLFYFFHLHIQNNKTNILIACKKQSSVLQKRTILKFWEREVREQKSQIFDPFLKTFWPRKMNGYACFKWNSDMWRIGITG